MAENTDDTRLKYDEDDALAFIRRNIPQQVSAQYSDDEITFVVDTVWDYYESKGLVRLNRTLSDNENKDLDALVDYVRRELVRDGEILMDPADVRYIVKAELAYEESIEMFDD